MSKFFQRLNASSRASPTPDAAPPPSAPPAPSSRSRRPTYICHTCHTSIPPTRPHIHVTRQSGERRYHQECFVCVHCHESIDPSNQSFCFDKIPANIGQEYPFHRQCFANHFGWVCVVCDKALPVKRTSSDGGGSQSTF